MYIYVHKLPRIFVNAFVFCFHLHVQYFHKQLLEFNVFFLNWFD